MTKPLPPAELARRKAARAGHRPPVAAALGSNVKDLHADFQSLAPNEALVYYSGENLARQCRDWDRDPQPRAESHQKLRSWAANMQALRLGFLTQKRIGPDTFDYRITRSRKDL